MNTRVDVVKLNPAGQETWRYAAQVLEQGPNFAVVEAYFDRQDMDLHGMLLRRGDRFVETYYRDRWYNIFEIHSHTDQRLRGWYCNISRPAVLEEHKISYVDLALDLLVFPDGRQIVLDEDEFIALALSDAERQQAKTALASLQADFRRKLAA